MKTAVLPPLRNSYALLPICPLLFSSDNIIFVVLLGGNGGGGKGQEMESDSDEGQEGAVLENLIRLGMSGLNGANVQRAAVTTAGKSDHTRVTAS